MSGNKDYLDTKLDETIEVLNKLSTSLLLDRVNLNPEAEKYLMLEEDALSKMTPAELASGEYLLSAYGLVIQRKINRANAIKNWASRCLERIIAKRFNDFDQMMKYEIRKAAVALNDDYAKRLSDIISNQDAIIDDLTYLSQSINNISSSLGNLARIRKNNYAFSAREN